MIPVYQFLFYHISLRYSMNFTNLNNNERAKELSLKEKLKF